MKLTIFGGIKEIGGNKIFISVGDKNFLFDFGLSFKDNNQYFSEFLSPRKLNGIVDYLYLDIIPPVNNLYRNDFIVPFSDILKSEPYNIVASDSNMVDAFFLTHAHLDHYKFVGFLKKSTPIYMNWISHTIIDYLELTSLDPLLSEILNYHELFKMVPKKRQGANEEIKFKRATKNDYNLKDTKRKIQIMKGGKAYTFKTSKGEADITQFQTDHSIPGACSYIFEHDGRSIIYTGDFKMHGFHRNWVNDFIEKARESNPVAIVTEGTRSPRIEKFRNDSYRSEDQSEEDVEIRSRDIIRHHSGLILVNCPIRNLDRILLYYKLAKRNNRRFAVTPKIFQLFDNFRMKLETMNESEVQLFYKDYDLPNYDDENLAIYLPRKGWGKFDPFDYRGFQKEIFKANKYITYKDVKKEPEKYLLYLDYYIITELIDLNQDQNTTLFINSTTDPFNKQMIIQEEKLNAWLDRFGILKTETIHSSGHCNIDDLIDFLQKIDADYIIPIHGNNPETFEEFGLSGKIILPEKGKQYQY